MIYTLTAVRVFVQTQLNWFMSILRQRCFMISSIKICGKRFCIVKMWIEDGMIGMIIGLNVSNNYFWNKNRRNFGLKQSHLTRLPICVPLNLSGISFSANLENRRFLGVAITQRVAGCTRHVHVRTYRFPIDTRRTQHWGEAQSSKLLPTRRRKRNFLFSLRHFKLKSGCGHIYDARTARYRQNLPAPLSPPPLPL